MRGVLKTMAKSYYKLVNKKLRQEYYVWRYDNKCDNCESSGFAEDDVCPVCKGLGFSPGTMVPEEYIVVCLEEFLDVVIDPMTAPPVPFDNVFGKLKVTS